MPDTFTLASDVSCPTCENVLLKSARFQWGEVPGQSYKIGDAIRWLRDARGETVESFKLQLVAPNLWRWNCGDPDAYAAILLDEDVYTGNHVLACEHCCAEISAISCHISQNRILTVSAITKAELDRVFGNSVGKASIATIDLEENITPREDWFDHVVEYDNS